MPEPLDDLLRQLPYRREKRFARACWDALTSLANGQDGAIPDPALYRLGADRSLGILLAVFRASGLNDAAPSVDGEE